MKTISPHTNIQPFFGSREKPDNVKIYLRPAKLAKAAYLSRNILFSSSSSSICLVNNWTGPPWLRGANLFLGDKLGFSTGCEDNSFSSQFFTLSNNSLSKRKDVKVSVVFWHVHSIESNTQSESFPDARDTWELSQSPNKTSLTRFIFS